MSEEEKITISNRYGYTESRTSYEGGGVKTEIRSVTIKFDGTIEYGEWISTGALMVCGY